MFCKKCGSQLNELNGNFICPQCGAEYLMNNANAAPTQDLGVPPVQSAEIVPAQDIATAAAEVTPRGFSSKKRILLIVLAAVVALCLGAGITVFALNNTPSRKVSHSMELAERYFSEQNYGQAIIEYEKIIEIEPKNADAYLGLADIYEKTGDKDKAIEILKKGIEQTQDERLQKELDSLYSFDQFNPGEVSSASTMSHGNDNPTASSASTTNRESDNPPAAPEFEWVLEPTGQYDDIVMLKSWLGPFSDTVTLYDNYNGQPGGGNSFEISGLYTAEKDGKLGLVDISGKEIAAPKYDRIIEDMGFLNIDLGNTLDTQYNLTPLNNGHGGATDSYILLNHYDHNLYRLEIGMGGSNYYKLSGEVWDSIENFIVLGAYFVPNDSGVFGEVDEFGHPVSYEKTDEMIDEILHNDTYGYGLYANGKLVVPTEFDTPVYDWFEDRFYGSSAQDKCVFKKDNKIYIYDLNGKCLSDGVYENVSNNDQEEVFFDGYLPVCRNGKWGLLDEKCNEAVTCQFEDISGVYGDKAWAKLNGKWGIIKIAGAKPKSAETSQPAQ